MSQPIGLFDSGLGGLTVFKALRMVFPHTSFIYLGDMAMLPYGIKTRPHVQRLSYRLMGYLLGEGAGIIIAACNSALGAIMPEAQEDFSVPIFGPIEPAAREAIKKSPGKRVGVLATTGTIQEGYYQRALERLFEGVHVIGQGAPYLVDLVEEGLFSGHLVTKVVRDYLTPFQGRIDTLILGCTHFPLLLKTIREELPHEVSIIDPAVELAKEVAQFSKMRGLCREGKKEYRFLSTAKERISKESLIYLREYLAMPSLEFSRVSL